MSDFNGGQVPPPQYPQQPYQPPRKKRTGLKIFLVVAILGVVGLVSCVAVVGSAVDEASKQSQGENVQATEAPSSTAPKASAKPSAEPKEKADYEYTGLKVVKDTGPLDSFAGTITIKNNTDKVHDYYVTVTVFKGEQDIGSLIGTIKVKANGSGKLKLTSLDDYQSGATDYQVEITQTDF